MRLANADDQGPQEETFCRRPPRFSKGNVPRFVTDFRHLEMQIRNVGTFSMCRDYPRD